MNDVMEETEQPPRSFTASSSCASWIPGLRSHTAGEVLFRLCLPFVHSCSSQGGIECCDCGDIAALVPEAPWPAPRVPPGFQVFSPTRSVRSG